MHDEQIARRIIEALPSPNSLSIFARLRRDGASWSDIEDRLDGLAEDIAASPNLPISHEAERYCRRLILAAYATEVGGMNN